MDEESEPMDEERIMPLYVGKIVLLGKKT